MSDELYTKVRNANDDLFALVARQMNLKTGDITPGQEFEYDKAVHMIADIMQQWIKQNS